MSRGGGGGGGGGGGYELLDMQMVGDRPLLASPRGSVDGAFLSATLVKDDAMSHAREQAPHATQQLDADDDASHPSKAAAPARNSPLIVCIRPSDGARGADFTWLSQARGA